MGGDVTTVQPSQAVAVAGGWTRERIELVKRTICKGATDDELMLFQEVCERTGLDPFKKQIYGIKRYDASVGDKVLRAEASIDGLRLIAQRSGQYAGQVGPEWCGEDGVWRDVWLDKGQPAAARVGVIRKGFTHPVYAVALWREYAQLKKDGTVNSMWGKYGSVMLAKCFDESTEVLTTNGFERFADVTGQVMQVTDNGVEPCDALPFWQPHSGEMVVLDSDDLNFAVTPNHDMVTTTGKVEAGVMFDEARSRPKYRIPRCVQGSKPESAMSDNLLVLAAAYMADGSDTSSGFRIAVARDYKVAALHEIALHRRLSGRVPQPAVSSSGRVLEASLPQSVYDYDMALIDSLVGAGKVVNVAALIGLSRRQARTFVDALVMFDGHRDEKSGVRRFYSSRLDHVAAFEVAAVAAGYAVSPRRQRTSDISARPNYCITISERNEIPVVRWGREHHGRGGNTQGRTGLVMRDNDGEGVWCVTVPSGEIIVRRNGFSMRCGNCAEALALRKAFPDDMSGVYTTDEMGAVSDDGMGSSAVEDGGLEGVTQFRDTQSIPSAQHEAKAAIGNARGVFGKDEADLAIRGVLEDEFAGKRFKDLDDEELRRLASAISAVTTAEVHRRQADDVVQMPGEPVDAEYEELPPDGLNATTRTFQVEGSKGDEYTIDVYEDGSWDCSCPARVDDCKHVKNLRRPYVAEDGSEAGWLWPGDDGYDNAPPSDTAVSEKVERTLAREVEPKPEHPLVEDGDGPQSEGAVVAELVEHGKALGLTEEEVMLTIARAGRGVAENLTKPHVKLSAKGAIGIAAREKKGEVITGD